MPNVFKGINNWSIKAFISTKSPNVIDPSTTPNEAKDLVIKSGNIKFKNVSFSYKKNRSILNNISLDIPAGKKVAIVGPSGAGKSTIGRLLFRFYNSNEGSIYIDDQDIVNCSQESLHKNIAVVPQDTVLFNESIFFNIQYANSSSDKEDVIKAATFANIHHFINSLPDNLRPLSPTIVSYLSGRLFIK